MLLVRCRKDHIGIVENHRGNFTVVIVSVRDAFKASLSDLFRTAYGLSAAQLLLKREGQTYVLEEQIGGHQCGVANGDAYQKQIERRTSHRRP